MEGVENIVTEWLKSLSLSHHGPSFIDNGYDDLEICKKIGEQDLDAIGVLNMFERIRILDAVNSLKLNGGTSVYLAIEEHTKRNSAASPAASEGTTNVSRPSSVSSEEKHINNLSREAASEMLCGDLTRIPHPKLQRFIKDRLKHDGIKLFNPPYSSMIASAVETGDLLESYITEGELKLSEYLSGIPDTVKLQTGERGDLDGLASHYADDLRTFYTDVLNVLEEIRVEEWKNMSPRMMVLQDGLGSVPLLPTPGLPNFSHGANVSSQMSLLDNPQQIYAPGKYSPSSCLSHCEEDVIYGLGGDNTGSATCILPCGEKSTPVSKKKPGGISKLLRTLRVRKEKSPRHLCQPLIRQGRKNASQGCKTLNPALYPRPALLRTDPKTQRRRVLQMTRDGELTLEEAMAWLNISRMEEEARGGGIYCNTQDQTAKYYKCSMRSHSQSPAHTAHGNVLPVQSCSCQGGSYNPQACEAVVHWYDEPSYENQDDYFLRKNCMSSRERCEPTTVCCSQESDVISLPSAGDIALGRHGQVYTRESPIGSSGRISSEELLCSNELSSYALKDKCCNPQPWTRNCWDSGDYIRQRSVRDSGDYAGSDSGSVSMSSLEEPSSSHVIGRCRALIDVPHDPRESSMLSIKKGEVVDILSTRPDGLWVGRTASGTGNVLANTVEVMEVNPRPAPAGKSCCTSRHFVPLNGQGGTFSAIKNVLKIFDCEEYLALLISNGYDDLEALRNLELSDLDLLGIRDLQSRTKLLSVVRYLHQTMDNPLKSLPDPRQSIRSNFSVGCVSTYRDPKDTLPLNPEKVKRPTFLQQYNIPVGKRCCGAQDYVNGELCVPANPDANSLLGRLQMAEASREGQKEEERDSFGDFGKRYGSEKSSDSGISVRSRSPAVQSPGQKTDGIFSSKRLLHKLPSHQNIMS